MRATWPPRSALLLRRTHEPPGGPACAVRFDPGATVSLFRHGERKFPSATLLESSKPLGWSGIAAELRSHPKGDLPAFRAEQMEVTLAVQGQADAFVSRSGDGARQETRVVQGCIWICPAGIEEDDIRITGPLPEILHIYLPQDRLADLERLTDGEVRSAPAIRYLAGIQDELVRQIALAVLSEMTSPTAGGTVLVESLSLSLMARLTSSYSERGPPTSSRSSRQMLMDDRRMRRVIEFMRERLEHDIGLEQLAGVACLSPFHFARTFRDVTGQPPHRYLSNLRMERAKVLIAANRQPLCDVALASGFSSQANFTRAFKQSVGVTPLDYRKVRLGL